MRSAAVTLYRLVHRHLLWCLILAYAAGALWPQLGQWIRGAPGSGVSSGWLLKAMLAMLLVNAGLGLDVKRLRQLRERWAVLVAAVCVSVVVPGLVVLIFAGLVVAWAMPDPAGATVIGLAIVAAMPVAGSSTAWSQNADGDMALTLALVFGSTLLSPLTAIVVPLATVSLLRVESFAGSPFSMSQAAALFLSLWVICPAVGGVILRSVIGPDRIERYKPLIKLANLTNLLLLNYANASLSLPAVLRDPRPMQLVVAVSGTVALALVAFPAAGFLARTCRVGAPQRASLYFGMGMKNNGAGLVLVSTTFALPGPILLPIIIYNIVQHLAAAVIDRFVLRTPRH